MQTDLIIINDFCDRCHVDPSFIMELEEDGLIEVRVIDEERYLPTSQLAELERYTHLYYDLSINIAGIDAIHHMLERIALLQQEVRSLRNDLEFYRENPCPERESENCTHFSFRHCSFTFIFLFLPLFLYDKQECRTDHHRFSSHYYIYQEKVMGCSALSSFFHLFSYFFPLYYPTFNLKSLSL